MSHRKARRHSAGAFIRWQKLQLLGEKNKGHSGRRTLAEIRIRVTLCATSSGFVREHLTRQIPSSENKKVTPLRQVRQQCKTFRSFVNFTSH